jgi:hypothetical protein
VRLKAKNALLVKIMFKRAICKLKIKDKLKIILSNINIFLAFI